ncbi:MAG: hypothetical protein ACLGSD_00345 [Acidobacteriota bacterium]
MINPLRPGFIALALMFLLTATTTACKIQLISDYDSVLDQDVTTLQQNTEMFLNQLQNEAGTPAADYSANTDFYVKTNASLATMATRAASQPKSKIIVGEVNALQSTFTDMQKLHQLNGDKGLSAANIANTRSALESEFTSILTLELALKANATVPSGALAPTKTQ